VVRHVVNLSAALGSMSANVDVVMTVDASRVKSLSMHSVDAAHPVSLFHVERPKRI
jgi:hypothetical protein